MSVPVLPDALRDAYLRRLGVSQVTLDLAGLTALQRAHLHRVPFHNLALLINDRRPYRVPSLLEIADENTRGVGGTCHLTTPPFAALLRTLGFSVTLIAGAVRHPGDHLLALVQLDEGDFIVDVGNGQPYPRPFPLGETLCWSVLGWTFRWVGDALIRRLPDGRVRRVYGVDPRPRTWDSFADAIRAHHERPDFGPFLAALRAARITEDVMLTVRDATLTRYGAMGASPRPIESTTAARRVLTGLLQLDEKLVDEALAAQGRRRPDVFASAELAAPRVLVAVPTIGREAQVARMLESLERDRVASGLREDELEVVILENVASSATRGAPRRDAEHAFSVRRYAALDESLALERELGLLPEETAPLSIGAARHALLRVVTRTLAGRAGSWIVWMLDDDQHLAQLAQDEAGIRERAGVPLLAEVRRIWREHPDISIGLGTFCGDPPIPGFATWLGQLRDLQATLEAMSARAPDEPWPRPKNDWGIADYYYDHAGDVLETGRPYLYEATPGATVGRAFAELARAWPAVARGSHVTRPLVLQPPRPPRPSIARGGHVVFLDRDALFAAPYPVHRGADGVVTRRADSLAALLVDPSIWRCREFDLPVLHSRRPADGSSPMARAGCEDRELAAFVESQARGVAMARALQHDAPREVGAQLSRRRSLHLASFAQTRAAVQRVRARIETPNRWWWSSEHEDHAIALLAALDELAARIPSDAALAAAAIELSAELASFCEALPARARSWRRAWR